MKKKLIFTLALSILGLSLAFSQSINGVPIAEIDVEYLQIVGTGSSYYNVNIEIDFGQEDKPYIKNNRHVKDENGRLIKFNSMMDALNFMNKHGYDFLESNMISTVNRNIYHYLLKKRN